MNEYVAGAYGVVLLALLVYVVAIGLKAGRMAREAELLARLVERQDEAHLDAEAPEDARPVDAPPPAARS